MRSKNDPKHNILHPIVQELHPGSAAMILITKNDLFAAFDWFASTSLEESDSILVLVCLDASSGDVKVSGNIMLSNSDQSIGDFQVTPSFRQLYPPPFKGNAHSMCQYCCCSCPRFGKRQVYGWATVSGGTAHYLCPEFVAKRRRPPFQRRLNLLCTCLWASGRF